jgi:hypothetical protein
MESCAEGDPIVSSKEMVVFQWVISPLPRAVFVRQRKKYAVCVRLLRAHSW